MTYSIYGGTGFIGGNFCEMFPSDVLKIPKQERNPESNKIIYFISTIDNYNVYTDLHVDINTNLNVLMETLAYCKDKNITFNFISSWVVYGRCRLPAREIDNCDPTGFYSITKRTAEQLLISFCKTFGVKYRILRLCNVYGHGDKKASLKKNVVQHLIDEIKRGNDINLYDGGYVLRDFMHVKDVCKAIKLVCDIGELDTIYNIGSGEPTALRQIIDQVKSIVDSKSIINSIKTPEFFDIVQSRDIYLDVSKLKSIGFTQTINLDDGIRELCLEEG